MENTSAKFFGLNFLGMPPLTALAAPILLMSLPLISLPLSGSAATSTAGSALEGSATIRGTIVDESGRPAADATVFVYSARLKNGYAIICPTCWIDCGKRANTNAQGEFTITDLNPALKFRLLVLKDGFEATAKGGVDPAQGPLQSIQLKPRSPHSDESMIVHGRVTDTVGSPIAGALIEPVEATEPQGNTWFGSISWLDPLAATNGSGEFEIASSKSVQKVVLKISPRGEAAQFAAAVPGRAVNAVVLTEGATVMGAMVEPNGKPIANAEVVLISHTDRDEQRFDDMRVGTDKDGTFVFTNVPARQILGIYPAQESLQGRDLTAGLRLSETIADREVVNVGKITLHPGFRLRGKIHLDDGGDIPPGMHVAINPEWTLYNRLADIASDGTFEFRSLAPDVYSLAVGIRGYVASPNSPQRILLKGDRRNVIIHMVRSP